MYNSSLPYGEENQLLKMLEPCTAVIPQESQESLHFCEITTHQYNLINFFFHWGIFPITYIPQQFLANDKEQSFSIFLNSDHTKL